MKADELIGYLRRDEACRYLGISSRCLSEWQARRIIPFVKAGRKCVLFRRDALDRAMEKLTVKAL